MWRPPRKFDVVPGTPLGTHSRWPRAAAVSSKPGNTRKWRGYGSRIGGNLPNRRATDEAAALAAAQALADVSFARSARSV